MSTRPPSLAVVLLVSAAALFIAAPVSAAPAPDYGASARCRYAVTESGPHGWTEALFNRLSVRPPVLYGNGGPQPVGWRFVVKRSLDGQDGPWQVRYVSPIQRATATTTVPAPFSTLRVPVAVPTNVEDQSHVWYTVVLKLFWYGNDGSVESKVSHQMSQMHFVLGRRDDVIDPYCVGLALRFFN